MFDPTTPDDPEFRRLLTPIVHDAAPAEGVSDPDHDAGQDAGRLLLEMIALVKDLQGRTIELATTIGSLQDQAAEQAATIEALRERVAKLEAAQDRPRVGLWTLGGSATH